MDNSFINIKLNELVDAEYRSKKYTYYEKVGNAFLPIGKFDSAIIKVNECIFTFKLFDAKKNIIDCNTTNIYYSLDIKDEQLYISYKTLYDNKEIILNIAPTAKFYNNIYKYLGYFKGFDETNNSFIFENGIVLYNEENKKNIFFHNSTEIVNKIKPQQPNNSILRARRLEEAAVAAEAKEFEEQAGGYKGNRRLKKSRKSRKSKKIKKSKQSKKLKK